MDNLYLITGLVIILVVFGGFFAFRFIKNQIYELKLDLLSTIRDREKMEKQSIKEGTRMISIRTRNLNEREIKLLIGRASVLKGVHEVIEQDGMVTLTVELLKKNYVIEELEKFSKNSNMNFHIPRN